jgi:hypothetical protein
MLISMNTTGRVVGAMVMLAECQETRLGLNI